MRDDGMVLLVNSELGNTALLLFLCIQPFWMKAPPTPPPSGASISK